MTLGWMILVLKVCTLVCAPRYRNLMPITKPHLRPRYSYTDGPPKRRIDADASLTRSWHELNLLRDEVHLPPGENNPNAVPGGKLCFEYMNKGRYI